MSRQSGIKVAVGILKDDAERLLITQRSAPSSHAGFWEFPGGKCEIGEPPHEALIREIKEEIDVDIQVFEHLGDVHHIYDNKPVHLVVYLIHAFEGEPKCMEGQSGMIWINLDESQLYPFPEANHKIIALLDQMV